MTTFSIDALRLPLAFPHPAGQITVLETHLSWVVLAGEYAYKIKKAVRFDFIDTTSLAERRRLCEEELRLNRRLAPGIYVDVAPIARQDDALRIDGSGEPAEYAVRMRRFDTSQELAALLERGDVQPPEILALAELLAAFHEHAAVAQPRSGLTLDLRKAVERASDSLRQHLASPEDALLLDEIMAWSRASLQRLAGTLRAREAAGWMRECHGDLHARNIVRWAGALTPFDCLEFDPTLRWIDVMNDLAFLYMDLQSHGRKDLAFTLLDRHLERTGDYGGLSLLPLYTVYRALVRAMVDALAARQQPDRRAQYEVRMRTRLHTAAAVLQPPEPVLLLMHGPSGSGKSWLSGQLVGALPAIRIRSDVERKRLAGLLRPDAQAGGGAPLYTEEFNQRTYARLLQCADGCLQGGFHVIVDAAFLKASERAPFEQLARSRGLRHLIIACESPPEVMAERIRERQSRKQDPSDADVAVLQRQLQSLTPLLPQEMPNVVTCDTRRPQAVTGLVAALASRMKAARSPALP